MESAVTVVLGVIEFTWVGGHSILPLIKLLHFQCTTSPNRLVHYVPLVTMKIEETNIQ